MNRTFFALAALALAAGAQAQVITIDQAKALAGNVTPDDAPGFPVTLSRPGSYRVMGNLTVADPAVSAFVITNPLVALDLNGFVISGPNRCNNTNQPAFMNCTHDALPESARGHGVVVELTEQATGTITIQGGTILGFAGHGVFSRFGDRTPNVHRIVATQNGMSGVKTVTSLVASHLVRNGRDGAEGPTLTLDSVARGNRRHGLFGGLVSRNASFGNGGNNYYGTAPTP
jgi:hypothetical protein